MRCALSRFLIAYFCSLMLHGAVHVSAYIKTLTKILRHKCDLNFDDTFERVNNVRTYYINLVTLVATKYSSAMLFDTVETVPC